MRSEPAPCLEPAHHTCSHPVPPGGRHYIASYEIRVDGQASWWGHLALRLHEVDALLQDPQALLDALCSRAATRHDVAASQVRLIMISRV